ncbi:Fe-S cluster assembly protein [Legionella gratiana]|uniref:Fe-S cluster assembly protein n=1 Tax=Legionella gratiana TaxID=45066 RepID=A0A378JDX9_9GAMM|nr:iron-sulfur cluster assembly accessory protein [Legionella gratiana]KTD09191.1 Fe-S cluster assembly protein [Legionella gratiana]STX45556.1 Fe-S cluster assembly protein [Legionella gratiana]
MSVTMHHTENKTPEISFTDAALKHVVSYLQKKPGHAGIRLSVKKTGCSGLSYVIDYVLAPLEGDLMLPLTEEYVVCVDKASYPFLKKMEVDYVKQGLNHKFVFNNPNQTGQCGCGESFTVD